MLKVPRSEQGLWFEREREKKIKENVAHVCCYNGWNFFECYSLGILK